MSKTEIFVIIDELKNTMTSDKLIQDRILNYFESNIDEFVECYEEIEE